jgi:NADH:ubiquinone oxidoreductase subunit 3 (subunit A)
LVDIICCCAVLVPIVWQVQSLEKSLESEGSGEEAQADENSAEALSRLKLFRSFYLTVVAYIYFTRIVVYLFATLLDFRHAWIRYFITELATLAFYIVAGLQFRPKSTNSYVIVRAEESEETMTFEQTVELELGNTEQNSKLTT